MGKYETFREQYPVFVYRSYEINETENSIEVRYEFEFLGLANSIPGGLFQDLTVLP